MILVSGNLVAREGSFEQALAPSLEHVRRSQTEPGCRPMRYTSMPKIHRGW